MATLISAAYGLAIIICMSSGATGFTTGSQCPQHNNPGKTIDNLKEYLKYFVLDMFNTTVQFDIRFRSPIAVSTSMSLAARLAHFASNNSNLHNTNITHNATNQSDPSGNIFISPFGIWSALISTYIGAENRSSDELARVLRVSGLDKVSVYKDHMMLQDLFEKTNTTKCLHSLKFFNKLYFENDIPILTCTKPLFGEKLENIDFKMSPEDSRIIINKWGRDMTNKLIQNLIPEGGVNNETDFITANMAYFKGYWKTPFDSEDTRETEFYKTPFKTYVNMMKIFHNFSYALSSSLGCSAVEIPFEDSDISMIALLSTDPNETVEALVARLSNSALENLYFSMEETMIELHFPKFHIEQTIQLKPLLYSLGIKDIFNEDNADFSAFTNKSIHMYDIFHTATVTVNEIGSSAFGYCRNPKRFATVSYSSRLVIAFNRPFVFFFRHNEFNNILFVGIFRQPAV